MNAERTAFQARTDYCGMESCAGRRNRRESGNGETLNTKEATANPLFHHYYRSRTR